MIRFGPAGNSESFYAAGFKSTFQAPKWLHDMGLNAYECSFGRGVTMGQEGAEKVRAQAEQYGIRVSAHAPYFINLSNGDPAKRENSFRYIMDTAQAIAHMGGDRVVVHVGALTGMARADAISNCRAGLKEAYQRLDNAGLGHVRLCPETMGKAAQIGDLQETLDFCLLDERLIPCVDFAHLHALGQGCLNREEDFVNVLDAIERTLGLERARQIHVHFSTIEYTAAGEKRHHTFDEKDYGPRFELLAPLFKARKYEPTVICECKGTMAEDAKKMADIFAAC